MLEGKPQEEVFSRLSKKKQYSPKKLADEAPIIAVDGDVEKITMHRGAPISVALYDMNKARIQKLQDKRKKQAEDEIKNLESASKSAKNKVSSQYLC